MSHFLVSVDCLPNVLCFLYTAHFAGILLSPAPIYPNHEELKINYQPHCDAFPYHLSQKFLLCLITI